MQTLRMNINHRQPCCSCSTVKRQCIVFALQHPQKDAFEKIIKLLLCNAPVLANFGDYLSITIQTEASKDGLGCYLLQDNK